MPSHLRDGRYGNWLSNARDWAISRNRFWGTPLPVWQSSNADTFVIGSRQQLMDAKPMRFTHIIIDMDKAWPMKKTF